VILLKGWRPRVREVGIRIGVLQTGRNNAITDVEGVKVGHATLIRGHGRLEPGKGPVRTGVTAVLPHSGNLFREKVQANVFVLNGFGKSVGLMQIWELGTLETPILLTNTLNVGLVMDALTEYMLEQNEDIGVTTGSVNSVVAECNDSYLNDIRGRHVRHEHVFEAIKSAKDGEVEEGAVGAGTGMSAFDFKGGIGTSSRVLSKDEGGYTFGVLVLSNFGSREDLRMDGVPVGRELKGFQGEGGEGAGSIITVVATDAPLDARQLGRLAKRAAHGIARTGSYTSQGSGDVIFAFSSRNRIPHYPQGAVLPWEVLSETAINPLFRAVVEATEEAIINSMFKARTVVGRDDHVLFEIPIEKVVNIMQKYGRL